ncbi:MAG: hypothetical protein HYS86_01030 [Candidatus Chisholmbacteria bacterium]|nr:hypothetical protein [Candidatus Chisholmbacteria bacterium]
MSAGAPSETGNTPIEPPETIRQFLDLVARKPPGPHHSIGLQEWQKTVSAFLGEQPEDFLIQNAESLLVWLRRVPGFVLNAIVRESALIHLGQQRQYELMVLAVSRLETEGIDLLRTLILNGFDTELINNPKIDLNLPIVSDISEHRRREQPCVNLLLSRAAERRNPEHDTDPLEDVVNKLITIERVVPLTTQTLVAILSSSEFKLLSVETKTRYAERVALYHGQAVAESKAQLREAAPGLVVPSLFEQIKLITGFADGHILALCAATPEAYKKMERISIPFAGSARRGIG